MKKDDQTMGVREDLREILVEFWVSSIESAPDYSDKIKASELLAKYFLGEGRTMITRKNAQKRPSTAEVLDLAAQLERIRE